MSSWRSLATGTAIVPDHDSLLSRANESVRSDSRSSVERISDSPPASFTAEWYDLAAADHFWFQWRFRVLHELICNAGLPTNEPLAVFDVGGGHGVLRAQIERATAWSVDIADLNPAGLERCGPGRGRLLYYDITEQRSPFTGSYDVALLMDVIEHIEDPIPFLRAVLNHLKPGGVLLVNVPALRICMSDYDVAAGHFRRYRINDLTRELRSAGATIIDARYWGLSMVPLLLLRKAVLALGRGRVNIIQTGFHPPSHAAHQVLRGIMAVESKFLRRPVLGTSVLAAARKSLEA